MTDSGRVALGLAAGQVRLLDAHEAWADAFGLERRRIIEVIGGDILDIQHVGSTAIPGIPAKPILDILVGVKDFNEAAACIAPLQSIGYYYRGEYGIPQRHYFVKGGPRTHHLHMVEIQSEHWLMTVRFRELLKSHPESARMYAEAKRRLAAIHSDDRTAYQREKDKIVESLLAAMLPSVGDSAHNKRMERTRDG